MDATQNAADALETYITDQILLNPEDQSFTIFPPGLGVVMRVFEDAKQELSKIKNASQPSDHILSPPVSSTRCPVSKSTVVGVEEDLNQLRARLTSARVTELDVIPIVGMGGMGKTTLARILYDEFSSTSHFDRCLWATVSQSYDPQQILRTLLACVTKQDKSEEKTSDLITTLYQILIGRRYLIVLDDIWSSKAWDDVQTAFARDNQGSRIIFTTRNNSLVEYVKSNGHEMQLINNDNSWELIRGKVFGKDSCPLELEEVGKRVALKCGGLPLALQVISGLLSQSERSKDLWEYVAHNVSLLAAKTDDKFDGIFSWSFAHLPHYLKPCFLYMGVFPEDDEIPESRLIQLWIAEGFLYPVPNKSLQEAAEMHLNALVDRNLIFVRTRKWNGKAKSYGIHDLLRDLCLRKAKEKKFLYVVDSRTDILQNDILGHDASIHIPETGRVSIHMLGYDDFGSLKLASLTRSIMVNGGVIRSNGLVSRLCEKSLLRVFDVHFAMRSYFQEMVLPLVNLRYLSVSRYSLGYSKVSALQNLQTVKIYTLESLAILEHLPQLRHLQFRDLEDGYTTDSFEISPHENLQYLSRVPHHKLTYLLEKLPNLRTLKVFISYEKNTKVDLTCFQGLESFSISAVYNMKAVVIFPQSMKRLKLFDIEVSQTLLHPIGILPRLQFLKFQYCNFENGTWEPFEGEFSQLQYLEIYDSKLENWLATDLQFPKLQHLVIQRCYNLNEIPNDFGEIDTLESIDVNESKDSVFDSARKILNKQLEFGNTLFQLRLGKSIKACKPSLDNSAWRILKEQRKLGNTLFQLQLDDVMMEVDVSEPSGSEEVEENVDGFPCKNQRVQELAKAFETLTVSKLGLKGLETQFSSSTFRPLKDFLLSTESLGLDTGHSYSLESSQGRLVNRTIAVDQRRRNSTEPAGTVASRQRRRKQLKATSLKPFNDSLIQFRPADDVKEVKWSLTGTGESSKGLDTQVSSLSLLYPSHDFIFTSVSLGLDSQHSYSMDSSQGSFANRTSDGVQRRQNQSNESSGTMWTGKWRRKQRK